MVRKVARRDIPAVYRIFKKLSLDRKRLEDADYRALVQKCGFLLGLSSKEDFLKYLGGIFLVYEDEGKILGYLTTEKRPEFADNKEKIWFRGGLKPIYYGQKSISIETIAVDPLHFRKGIAQKLLKRLEKLLLKQNYKYLFSIITTSPVTNYPSIAFHEKNGFFKIATRMPGKLFGLSEYQSNLYCKELSG